MGPPCSLIAISSRPPPRPQIPNSNHHKTNCRQIFRPSACSFAIRITPDTAASRLIQRRRSQRRTPNLRPHPAPRSAKRRAQNLDQQRSPISQAGGEHWSISSPSNQPSVKIPSWPRNPIDNFVLARLQQPPPLPRSRQINPNPPPLPRPDPAFPTPAELAAFFSDTRPDAYNPPRRTPPRLAPLRRTLEPACGSISPATPIPTATKKTIAAPCRPTAIRSSRPQLQHALRPVRHRTAFRRRHAHPNATNDQKIAPGSPQLHLQQRGDRLPKRTMEYMQLDRATTTATPSSVPPGLRRKCHDHKFDPFTQKQFYQMVAFFNNADFV